MSLREKGVVEVCERVSMRIIECVHVIVTFTYPAKKNESKENINPHTLSPVLSWTGMCAALTHTLTLVGGGTPALGVRVFDIEFLFDWDSFD